MLQSEFSGSLASLPTEAIAKADVVSLPDLPITLADVQQAARVLESYALKTPLLESAYLNQTLGGRVLVKAECLQRTGAFKFRGAFYAMSQIPEDKKDRGVVAYTSGNHGQAIAYCAQLLGMPATIIMPKDAPQIKIDRALHYGANIVLFDRFLESREAIGQALIEKTGSYLIPPFEHPDVIAGQGTIGLEIVEQCQAMNMVPTQVLIPSSGGGMAAGCALVIKHYFPDCDIYSVEPMYYDDLAQSLVKGERVGHGNQSGEKSICDSLMAPMPGELAFAINRFLLKQGVSVSESSTYQAMRLAFENLKIVLEPGGAVGLAALVEAKVKCPDHVTIVIGSGGNVDPVIFTKAIQK